MSGVLSMRMAIIAAAALLSALCPTWSTAAAADEVWVQDSFEDFRAGVFEDGGANLYATRAAQLRSIYTFDYNRDGANDVLFVCGHNVNDAPPTYLYMSGGGNSGVDTRHRWALRNDGAAWARVQENLRGLPPNRAVYETLDVIEAELRRAGRLRSS